MFIVNLLFFFEKKGAGAMDLVTCGADAIKVGVGMCLAAFCLT